MRKIITFVVLSFCSAIGLHAEETTLWEGDYNVSWDLPDGDAHKEWKELGQTDFAAFEVGQVLYFYFTSVEISDPEKNYHAYKFDDWSWEALPGQAQVDFSGDTKVTFTVTQEIKDAVAKNGFALHGHGYHVTKVTTGSQEEEEEEVIADLEPTLLWAGESTIDGWGANCLVLAADSEGFDVFAQNLTTACNLYFLLENNESCDFRIAGQWGDWAETSYPSDGYNHMQAVDADGVVKVSLSEEFVKQAFVNKGGIAFWGNGGFKIKAIATTKDALSQATAINAVIPASSETGKIYTINGVIVDQPTKGINILNGKKYYVR